MLGSAKLGFSFEDISSLATDIASAVDMIPASDPNWAKFKTEFQSCMKIVGGENTSVVDLGVGGWCLYNLWEKINDYRNREQSEVKPVTIERTIIKKETDVLPLVLAAGAGAGLIALLA